MIFCGVTVFVPLMAMSAFRFETQKGKIIALQWVHCNAIISPGIRLVSFCVNNKALRNRGHLVLTKAFRPVLNLQFFPVSLLTLATSCLIQSCGPAAQNISTECEMVQVWDPGFDEGAGLSVNTVLVCVENTYIKAFPEWPLFQRDSDHAQYFCYESQSETLLALFFFSFWLVFF